MTKFVNSINKRNNTMISEHREKLKNDQAQEKAATQQMQSLPEKSIQKELHVNPGHKKITAARKETKEDNSKKDREKKQFTTQGNSK